MLRRRGGGGGAGEWCGGNDGLTTGRIFLFALNRLTFFRRMSTCPRVSSAFQAQQADAAVWRIERNAAQLPLSAGAAAWRQLQLLGFLARESASRRPRAAPAWAYGHACWRLAGFFRTCHVIQMQLSVLVGCALKNVCFVYKVDNF
jgi:hypothetical protein